MNRKKLGIIITFVALLSTLIMGIITLFRVKLVLDNYGAEINGLMQVAVQMSAYLLLIESGMTAAYQYNMYSKIKENDINSISKLYVGLILNMKKIGVKMLLISLILPFIYLLFINRIEVTYLDAVLVLLVMGIRFSVPYLFVIPQRGILAAYERQYTSDLIQLLLNVIVIIIEAVVIYSLTPPLYLVLMIYIVCELLTVPLYNLLVRKITNIKNTKYMTADMSPKEMTNDILIHQVSSLVFFNTDNILLSIFKNLESVTIYSAFNTLISYPTQIINKIIGGLRASLAIKIQGKDKNAFSVYNEILSIVTFCASIVVPIFILMSNKFVELWIGKEYTLAGIDVILFGLIILNRMINPVVCAARDARGLYKESKKYTVIQAILNIIISIMLVKPLGITGILIGTVVSMYLVSTPFNFHLVYKEVFKEKTKIVFRFINIILVTLIVIFIESETNKFISFSYYSGWSNFIFETIFLILVTVVVSSFIYLLSDSGFRRFIKRFINF